MLPCIIYVLSHTHAALHNICAIAYARAVLHNICTIAYARAAFYNFRATASYTHADLHAVSHAIEKTRHDLHVRALKVPRESFPHALHKYIM